MTRAVLSLGSASGSMTATLEQFRHTVLFGSGRLGDVSAVGISLAAFCVCIAMVSIVRKYHEKARFDWWEFTRPILVFLLVCNFGTLVLRPLDAVCGVYNGRLSKAVGGSMTEFQQVFRDAADRVAAEAQALFDERVAEVEASDGSWLSRKARVAGLSLRKWVEKQTGTARTTLASAGLGLVFILFKIMCAVMVITATLHLTVMALIGPFTFALSILPSYPGGIRLWVERYIQYSLWIPLTHIACYLCTSLARMDLEFMLGGTAANGVENMGYCFTAILLLILSFRLIRQIPGLASYIIESGSHETISRDMIQGLGGGLTRILGRITGR